MSIDVENFKIPFSVAFKDRWGGIPLEHLSDRALSSMCDEFRRGVFKQAKKRDPQMPVDESVDGI